MSEEPIEKERAKTSETSSVGSTRGPRQSAHFAPRPTAKYSVPPKKTASFFQRYGVLLMILAGLGGALAWLIFHKPGKTSAAVKKPEPIIMVKMAPPPPPPPPPPKIQPPPEQKMVEQTPVNQPEEKPADKPKAEPPKAKDEPPASPLGTGIKGDAPGSGLGSSGGLGGEGSGHSGAAGSRFGWYAGQVQSRISEALRKNARTRNASIQVEVSIWPDATGRITRAQLARSTGDAALDSAIKEEVLNGLQLQEPPPAGMPLPIKMRLTARRPG